MLQIDHVILVFKKYCDIVIHQIWQIREKNKTGLTALRPEETVLVRDIGVVKWLELLDT